MNQNVVVDKPLVTKFKEFQILYKIAKKKKLILIEGTFHISLYFLKLKKKTIILIIYMMLKQFFICLLRIKKYKVKNLLQIDLLYVRHVSLCYRFNKIFFKENCL